MNADRNATREALASDLRKSQDLESHHRWRHYARWCVANEVEPYPTPDGPDGETLLLRYLHAHWLAHGWRGLNILIVGGHVARTFVAAGHKNPRGERWRGYLRAAQKTRPPLAKGRMDGFSEDQVLAVREALASVEVAPEHHWTAAVVALCDVLELPPPSKVGLTDTVLLDNVEVRATELLIAHQGQRVLVISDRQPHHFRVLARAFATAREAGAVALVGTPPGEAAKSWRHRHRERLLGAVGRLRTVAAADMNQAQLAELWEQGTRQRTWLVRFAENPELVRSRQDTAYFLAGMCFGGRYNELSALRFHHMTRSDETGYAFELCAHEHKGGRIAAASGKRAKPMRVEVPHILQVGTEDHPSHCPACALADHLEIRRLHGAASHDFIFVGPKSRAKLDKNEAGRIVRRVFARTEHLVEQLDDRPRRINTRSIRITTATLARLPGLARMSLVELAELLGHQYLSTTVRYVRRNGDYEDLDLVMPIGASTHPEE